MRIVWACAWADFGDHRPTSAGQTALWYTVGVPESTRIDDRRALARH